MNKLDLRSAAPTHPAGPRFEIPDRSATTNAEQHLLVLIPADSDYSSLVRQIWKLADATHLSVLLLSLCKDGVEKPGLQRRLTALCALLLDAGVPAKAKAEIGSNWVAVIKRSYQEGDVIACFAEQCVSPSQHPLSQILQSNVDAPIYILSSAHAQTMPQSNWFSEGMAWTGSVGIIVGAFLLQVQITSLPQSWAQTTLLIGSMIGEIWLIWAWNHLFS